MLEKKQSRDTQPPKITLSLFQYNTNLLTGLVVSALYLHIDNGPLCTTCRGGTIIVCVYACEIVHLCECVSVINYSPLLKAVTNNYCVTTRRESFINTFLQAQVIAAVLPAQTDLRCLMLNRWLTALTAAAIFSALSGALMSCSGLRGRWAVQMTGCCCCPPADLI